MLPDGETLADGVARAYGYDVVPPGPALRELVVTCWVDRHIDPAGRRPSRIVPDGCPHLLFYVTDGGRGHLRYIGPRSTWVDADRGDRTMSLIVRLHPGAALPLTDRSIDLSHLWGRTAIELCRRLERAGDVRAMLDLLGEHLPRRLVEADPVVRQAAGRLQARPAITLPAVAAEVGLSERGLRRRFAAAIGLGPKRFARIARLQRVIGLAASARADPWASLAVRAGYADQPHLAHEFRSLLGTTPAGFMEGLAPASDSYKTSGRRPPKIRP